MTLNRAFLAFALAGSLLGFVPRRCRSPRGEHDTPQPPTQKWSFAGPFGKYDRAQLQRGFKVYREVCARLPRPDAAVVPQSRRAGRAGFHDGAGRRRSPPNTRSRTARTTGEMFERPAVRPTASRRRSPNENAARAANGGACRPTCR